MTKARTTLIEILNLLWFNASQRFEIKTRVKRGNLFMKIRMYALSTSEAD